jgi:glutathione-regulated potassium-efflux system ancillary protein KefC
VALVDLVRQHFPQLTIVARARNAQHWIQLYQRGVRLIERETLDAALFSGRSVLEQLGFEPHHARTLALRFRKHSVEQLVAMAPHVGDEARLISMSKAGRQQLERVLAQERELAQRTRGFGQRSALDGAAPDGSTQAVPGELDAGEQQAGGDQPIEPHRR